MSGAGTQMLAASGAALIRALSVTWRYRILGKELHDDAHARHPAMIYCFWHGRLLPMCWLHRSQDVQILASEHRDGERLGQTIRHFGYGHVRGSSTRGGTRALRALARCVRDGRSVGLTVDGPTGPRYIAKAGAIEVARLTGAPVIPVTSASSRHHTFSSWDAFELPLPFSRVAVVYGRTLEVARDADATVIEEKRKELERSLQAITEEADAFVRGE